MPAGGLTTRGPRNLLRQIREAMAGAAPAQERLDQVVRIIAQSMVAEVCSIYLRRASGELELFATQGLKPEAVHNTRLRPGEGLVGEVARTAQPISLSDAPSHPSFSYRPETGEDPYHAFLGAPLLRGGRAIGVLVVQNRSERRYDDDEVEDIQTIAMVLAETVASGELLAQDELRDVEVAPHRPERLKGQRFAEGLAFGHVVLHEAPLAPENLLAENQQVEEIRLREALIGAQGRHRRHAGRRPGQAGGPVVRGAGNLPDVRRRPGLEPVAGGGGAHRPDRRGRRGPGPQRTPRPLRPGPRPLYQGTAARLRGPGQPAAAGAGGRQAGRARPARRRHPGGPQPGPRRPAGISAAQAEGPAARRGLGRQPRRHRGPGAADPLRRPPAWACATGCREGDLVIVDGETGEAYLRPRPDMLDAVQSRMAVREPAAGRVRQAARRRRRHRSTARGSPS